MYTDETKDDANVILASRLGQRHASVEPQGHRRRRQGCKYTHDDEQRQASIRVRISYRYKHRRRHLESRAARRGEIGARLMGNPAPTATAAAVVVLGMRLSVCQGWQRLDV